MELLLNLFWLLLAMPAYWLWRYSRTAPQRRKFNALQCFLALGCLLVILFPVVSASDDLRAMRELGVKAIDFNFGDLSVDAMRQFHEEVVAKSP